MPSEPQSLEPPVLEADGQEFLLDEDSEEIIELSKLLPPAETDSTVQALEQDYRTGKRIKRPPRGENKSNRCNQVF